MALLNDIDESVPTAFDQCPKCRDPTRHPAFIDQLHQLCRIRADRPSASLRNRSAFHKHSSPHRETETAYRSLQNPFSSTHSSKAQSCPYTSCNVCPIYQIVGIGSIRKQEQTVLVWSPPDAFDTFDGISAPDYRPSVACPCPLRCQ